MHAFYPCPTAFVLTARHACDEPLQFQCANRRKLCTHPSFAMHCTCMKSCDDCNSHVSVLAWRCRRKNSAQVCRRCNRTQLCSSVADRLTRPLRTSTTARRHEADGVGVQRELHPLSVSLSHTRITTGAGGQANANVVK